MRVSPWLLIATVVLSGLSCDKKQPPVDKKLDPETAKARERARAARRARLLGRGMSGQPAPTLSPPAADAVPSPDSDGADSSMGAARALPKPAADDAPPETMRVTLVSAGREPRRRLRHRLTEGAEEKMELSVEARGKMREGDKQLLKGKMRRKSWRILVSAPRRTPEGHLRLEYRSELPQGLNRLGRLGKRVQRAVGMVRRFSPGGAYGVGGWLGLGARGLVPPGAIHVPHRGNPWMRWLIGAVRTVLAQLSPMLPAEPVGVGAKWRFTHASRSPLHLRYFRGRGTFELLRLKGDRATVRIRTIGRDDPGPLTVGRARGARVHLDTLVQRGDMRVDFDLRRRVAKVTATGEVVVKAVLKPARGKSRALQGNVRFKIRVKPL